MKALILAAGKHAGVSPLMGGCPKPMLRILDTPVLELLIGRLRASGIDQLMITTSDNSGSIESYFGDGSRFGVAIAYSFEGYRQDGQLVSLPLGSAGAIRNIQRHAGFFDDTFVVVSGDALIDIDFTALIEQHHRHQALATVALAEASAGSGGGNIVVHPDTGMITGFGPRPASATTASALVNAGVYVFEPQVIGCIGREWPIEIDSDLLPALVREALPVHGAALPLLWLPLATPADYHRACRLALEGRLPGFTLPGCEIAAGLRTGLNVSINPRRCSISGPVVIGGGARIGDGATLVGPCYIGAGAVITAGARVDNSIVLPHARIGAEAHLQTVVTDGAFCATADGCVIDLALASMQWIIGDARMHDTTIQLSEQRFLDSIH